MIISAIFLLELLIKIVAQGFKPWRFFYGSADAGWNRMDFVIVAASFTPLGSLALLLRMVRLFRVLKLLKVVPQLRMLVIALMDAMESILYTCILMSMYFFCCAIVCVMAFAKNDPQHFKNLHVGIMTLFQSATGDNWTDIMYTAQYGCDVYPATLGPCDEPHAFGWYAVIFWCAFYTMGGLVFLNLFIGVVTAGMSNAMEEVEDDMVAEQRVKLLQELSNGDDLSMHVCDSLTIAFHLLDTHGANRLDSTDLQFAFYLMHLFPSKAQVNELLFKTCQDLAHLQGRVFDASDEDTFLDLGEWIHMLTNSVIVHLPKSPTCDSRHLSIAMLLARNELNGAGIDVAVEPTDGSAESNPFQADVYYEGTGNTAALEGESAVEGEAGSGGGVSTDSNDAGVSDAGVGDAGVSDAGVSDAGGSAAGGSGQPVSKSGPAEEKASVVRIFNPEEDSEDHTLGMNIHKIMV
jgi:voltage-gated sodium channel